jgi:hypothetical protein
MPWELTGNSNTNPATNFLGTADNQPLTIKTNGQERIRVTSQGTLQVHPVNDTTEGGEIALLGAGTNAPVVIDNVVSDFRVLTDGNERLRVGSNGNVGIGTEGPLSKLSIVASSERLTDGAEYAPFGIYRTGTAKSLLVGYHSTGEYAYIQSIERNISVRPLVLQPSGGNVGIGTSAPSEKLTVAGRVQSTNGGFVFPDGSVQTTATLRGPQGFQGNPGPQGPPGPAGPPGANTFAVISATGVCSCSGGSLIERVFGPCAVTSQTGPLSQNGANGSCCVCRP